MPFDDINVGTTPNDGTGDTLRATGQKVNANFDKAVEGPVSAVDNRVASFDGATGKLIQDSGLLSTELATVNAAGTLSASERPSAGLWLPGLGTDYVSAPDKPALTLTDLDARGFVQPESWSAGVNQVVIAQALSSTTNASWLFQLRSAGGLGVLVSSDGVNFTVISSTAAVPFADGEFGWVRVAYDADSGAGQYLCRFYTSPDGVTWTQLGADVTGTSVTLFDSAADLTVGMYGLGIIPFHGVIYRAQVLDGIDGTLVADFDATSPPSRHGTHPSAFTDSVGNPWTINGSAWEYRDDLGRTLATAAEAAASTRGVASGIATLDANALVPQSSRMFAPYRTRMYPAVWASSTASSYITKDRLVAFPVWLDADDVTIDLLGIEVLTAQPDVVLRLGLYAADGDQTPGPLLVDAGTVDCSTTGIKTVAVSPTVQASGLVWFAYAQQGVGTARPSLRALTPSVRLPHTASVWLWGANIGPSTVYEASSVTGAFPASANFGGFGGTGERIATLVRCI